MENLAKKPSKSILKSSSSFEQAEAQRVEREKDKDIKWDEMNILQTLHPPDKDYGHMKVEEPKTPYIYYNEDGEETAAPPIEATFDVDVIASKISQEALPKALTEEEDEEEDENLTEEEKLQKRDFENKRKMHYNEFYAVKLARKLLEEEGDKEEENDNEDEDGKRKRKEGGDVDEDDVLKEDKTCEESIDGAVGGQDACNSYKS